MKTKILLFSIIEHVQKKYTKEINNRNKKNIIYTVGYAYSITVMSSCESESYFICYK